MCNPDNVQPLREQAIQRASELLNGRNIDELTIEDFREFSSNLVDSINLLVLERFPNSDGSDSGERANEERRLSMDIANRLNISYDANSFQFIRN